MPVLQDSNDIYFLDPAFAEWFPKTADLVMPTPFEDRDPTEEHCRRYGRDVWFEDCGDNGGLFENVRIVLTTVRVV